MFKLSKIIAVTGTSYVLICLVWKKKSKHYTVLKLRVNTIIYLVKLLMKGCDMSYFLITILPSSEPYYYLHLPFYLQEIYNTVTFCFFLIILYLPFETIDNLRLSIFHYSLLCNLQCWLCCNLFLHSLFTAAVIYIVHYSWNLQCSL